MMPNTVKKVKNYDYIQVHCNFPPRGTSFLVCDAYYCLHFGTNDDDDSSNV